MRRLRLLPTFLVILGAASIGAADHVAAQQNPTTPAPEARKQVDPALAALVGKAFLILSKEHVVSGQDFDGATLWVSAKLGHVPYPTSKAGGEVRFETEYVPTDPGIVVRFRGPYDSNTVQKAWTTAHDREKRTFEIQVTLPGEKFIGITGSYGSSFPAATVDELMSLAPVAKDSPEKAVKFAGVKDTELDRKVRESVFDKKPAILDFKIGWHEIEALSGQSQWHILGTHWWVRLYPEHHAVEKLDKAVQYKVRGVALQQDYGTISVWAYDLEKVSK